MTCVGCAHCCANVILSNNLIHTDPQSVNLTNSTPARYLYTAAIELRGGRKGWAYSPVVFYTTVPQVEAETLVRHQGVNNRTSYTQNLSLGEATRGISGPPRDA